MKIGDIIKVIDPGNDMEGRIGIIAKVEIIVPGYSFAKTPEEAHGAIFENAWPPPNEIPDPVEGTEVSHRYNLDIDTTGWACSEPSMGGKRGRTPWMTERCLELIEPYEPRWFTDPGHGWLQVPRCVLTALEIEDKMTHSYISEDGKIVYLEEDQDAGVLIDAWVAAGLNDKEWFRNAPEVYHEDNRVRNLPFYQAA